MSNNNENNNPNNPHIKIVMTDDPSIMECLPPELREMIKKDLGGGDPVLRPIEEEPEEETPKEKIKFDFGMINCNSDLKVLTKKLKSSKQTNYGILLYGESGCGKSYFGQYLAQELGMPVIKKRASDLIDKWVGATEKNIQAAFKEAKQKKAVLIFDEADSFLFDRKYAQRDFECASTNELLTQMEDHPYPFIMTTNLKEKLDKATEKYINKKEKELENTIEYRKYKNNTDINNIFNEEDNVTLRPENYKFFMRLIQGRQERERAMDLNSNTKINCLKKSHYSGKHSGNISQKEMKQYIKYIHNELKDTTNQN